MLCYKCIHWSDYHTDCRKRNIKSCCRYVKRPKYELPKFGQDFFGIKRILIAFCNLLFLLILPVLVIPIALVAMNDDGTLWSRMTGRKFILDD
jgi:hypothetical protein